MTGLPARQRGCGQQVRVRQPPEPGPGRCLRGDVRDLRTWTPRSCARHRDCGCPEAATQATPLLLGWMSRPDDVVTRPFIPWAGSGHAVGRPSSPRRPDRSPTAPTVVRERASMAPVHSPSADTSDAGSKKRTKDHAGPAERRPSGRGKEHVLWSPHRIILRREFSGFASIIHSPTGLVDRRRPSGWAYV
jgi:hypothetical protein